MLVTVLAVTFLMYCFPRHSANAVIPSNTEQVDSCSYPLAVRVEDGTPVFI